jgi:hypothetical protein
MKKIAGVLSLVLCAMVGMVSCYQKQAATPATNSMTAVVDSNLFTASDYSVTAVKNGNQLVITGTTPGNVKLALYVTSYLGFDGVTNLDNISGTGILDSASNTTTALTGYVNITLSWPYLQGTFYFLCADSTYVTHGKFNVVAP